MSQSGIVNVTQTGGNPVLQITPDVGGPVTPVLGNINLNGAPGIVTSKNGAGTILITVSGANGLTCVKKTITSAQVKDLVANPIELVSAPGAGMCLIPVTGYAELQYGGTSVFTNTSSLPISYNYELVGVTTFTVIPPQITSNNADSFALLGAFSFVGPALTSDFVNTPLTLVNSNTDFTGNAANDNNLIIQICYVVLTI